MCQNPFKAPAAPDYTGAAQAQGAANIEAARQQGIMNNPNIIGPSGGQTVTFGANGQPTITQNLSPQEQQIFNLNQQARLGLGGVANQGVSNVANTLGQPFDFANYLQTGSLGGSGQPQTPARWSGPATIPQGGGMYGNAGVGNSSFKGQAAQPAPMGTTGASPTGVPQQSLDLSNVAQMPVNPGQTGQQAIMSRLQPQIQMQRNQLQTQLANQGLTPGGEAYNNAMRIENQQENDMLQQAALQGIGLDFTANQQGFNQALQGGQFGNTAQAQALQQGLQQRELPLNEATALMSGGQVSMPAFQGYQGAPVQPSPIMQGVTNQGNYQAGVYNSQMQGLAGLMSTGLYGASLGMFSDRRLKSNIRKIGVHKSGVSIYEYDIFGRHETGVMAQEVEKVYPEAVFNHPSGYKMVKYAYLA
jgi:hypothetical protein